MGVAYKAAQITVTGTATNLTSLLGLPEKVYFQTLAFRAAKANLGDIFLGSSAAVTTTTDIGGFLDAGEALTFDLADGRTSTDQFWFIAGSPGDILYVSRLE